MLKLTIFSLLIAQDVFWKFQSFDSSFTTKEQPITEEPTIIICFPYQFNNFTYGTDFNISKYFYLKDYIYKQNEFILREGENLLDQKIVLSKIHTVLYGQCYEIVSKILDKKPGLVEAIKISVKESSSEEDIPPIQIYFTSENNSYGITRALWKDGEVLSLHMNLQQRYMAIWLTEERYQYLRDKTPCRDEPFHHCYGSRLVSANFEECPEKCLAHSVPKSVAMKMKIPICQPKSNAKNCNNKFGIKLMRKLLSNGTCLSRACSTIQYGGKVLFEESHPESPLVHEVSRAFSYQFLRTSMAIHQEYLIYDFSGMLGSVGGTLGMFIGFSFVGFSSMLISYFQVFVDHCIKL